MLAKEVSKILKRIYEVMNMDNCKKVTEKLQTIEIIDDNKALSLDVKDTFSNIPINKTIEINIIFIIKLEIILIYMFLFLY